MTPGSRFSACLVASLLALTTGGGLPADESVVTYFVPEELPVGSVVGNIIDDFDLAAVASSDVQFEFLVQPSGAEYLRLESDSWNVEVAGRIDREVLCDAQHRCALDFTVVVVQASVDVLRLLSIELHVLDVNDHSPTFVEVQQRHLIENAPIGTQLPIATVRDLDLGISDFELHDSNVHLVDR